VTQITQLLERMHAGDAEALEALFANAYAELRRLAQARLRDGGRNTVLQTTSLVHESYLHEALLELEAVNARLARVVEMRYFGGYTEREIAETLGVTDRTVRSDWERARLILPEALR
jgi:DNA-directed RNA polymerase specialized sigma24 family protein